MTMQHTRRGRRGRREFALQIAAERIVGRWSGAAPPGPVAILLDGATLAIMPAASFEWALPHHLFGRLLDVVEIAGSASLLDGPVDFEAHRRVVWGAWRLDGQRVCGAFAVAGRAAPASALPLPVALIGNGASYGRGFAAPGPGGYTFAIEIDRLPGGIDLRPMVGACILMPSLHVPSEAIAFAGFVEPSEPWRVSGWALERGGRPVDVDLLVDGRLVATAAATRMRADVAAEGLGDGRCGFDIKLPASVRLDRPALVDVRVAPDGPSLGNSPYLRAAAPPFLGMFDGLNGFHAGGWALDTAAPEQPVRVEAVCDGAVVGSAMADLYRRDVAEAGLPTARCGFHFALDAPASRLVGRDVAIRVAGGPVLQGSPRPVALNPNVTAFLERGRTIPPRVLDRLRRRLSHRTRALLVSIVMPVHETRRDWLIAAIESVRRQWSDRWELICIDDGSTAPHVQEVLSGFARADQRIRVLRTPVNLGIASAVNFGLRAARGEYVAFLDHDDALEPDAVYHLANAALRTGADLLYSDEVLTGEDLDQVLDLRARPAFSHDYYLSHPYFVHLVCVRTALARAVAGYDERMAISADVDFVLRAIERAGAIAHIPRVLYRWRTHAGSAGHRLQAQVMAATQGALTRHLRRLGRPATVAPGLGFNQFRIDWPDDGGEVLAIIPTKDRVDLLRCCIDSIERTTIGERLRIVVVDHQSSDPATIAYLRELASRHTVMPYRGRFNFARMNNEAVRFHGAGARHLLFLNNDIEALAPGWLPRLRSLAARPEVGAVGPLLLYDNDRVQHAGVIVGFGGAADHAMRFADAFGAEGARNPGYNASLTSLRDFSAVTAACMMVRRDAFDAVSGFDERFGVGYNDTDLCLRLRTAGLKVLYDGQTVLRHHESATRAATKALADPQGDNALFRARWARNFSDGDPFYNPQLAASGADHVLRADAAPSVQLQPRVVRQADEAPLARLVKASKAPQISPLPKPPRWASASTPGAKL